VDICDIRRRGKEIGINTLALSPQVMTSAMLGCSMSTHQTMSRCWGHELGFPSLQNCESNKFLFIIDYLVLVFCFSDRPGTKTLGKMRGNETLEQGSVCPLRGLTPPCPA
jgi:hypothetical protein